MKQANQDRGSCCWRWLLAYRLMVLSQRCLLHCAIFCIPDYFPVADGLLPHQRYLNRTMPVGLPGLAAAFLFSAYCCTAR